MNARHFYNPEKYSYCPDSVTINTRDELGDRVAYLSKKLGLRPSAVVAYCVSRIYDKEVNDEKRMQEHLDGDMIQW